MSLKKIITTTKVQYDDCNKCSFLKLPDKNGIIQESNPRIIIDPDYKPKPIYVGYCFCGRGKRRGFIRDFNGCTKWHTIKEEVNETITF
jgi:hypothetical protein